MWQSKIRAFNGRKLREIEEKLGEAIDIANSIGLNFNELVGMLKTLKEL